MRNPSEDMRNNPLFVNSLAKGFAVLRAFHGAGRYLSLAEITARSNLDKSTAQRMTHTLAELGYLERCPDTRRYALGTPLLDFSYQFVRSHPLVEVATPHLIELRRSCEERVDMSLFDTHTVVYAVRLQSKRDKYYTTLVGRRMPVFCNAGGRAILAQLPEDEARRIIDTSARDPLTTKTITDPDAIMERIGQARRNGYAIALEESILGEITLGAALRDDQGRPVGAVHIAASTAEWNAEEMESRLVPKLMETIGILNRQHYGTAR